MSGNPWKNRKVFTVEQANAALPLVRAITRDLAELSRDVIDRRERLSLLLKGRERDKRDLYGEELVQVQEELERDTDRLQAYVEELRELGVEPKNGPEGLIDFPAVMDGRAVYLCWKLGEAEVLHWHDLEAGFRGRQPLTAGSASLSDGGSDLAADGVDAGGDSFGAAD
ncbi:MAG TPA: DUF2203 domain-containing protein [Pirellulales bacterium]|nr:DUF2203 domain-containing protein [Pirellulales bacterium]